MLNFRRFTNYIRYDLSINGKVYALALVAIFCLLVITDYFFLIKAYHRFTNNQYEPLMAFGLIISGILFVGGAFPAFRNKQKTVSYLTLPVSSLEKFLWEFLLKVPVLFIIYLSIFWMAFETAEKLFRITRPQDLLFIDDFRFFEMANDLEPNAQVVIYFGILSIGALLLAGATFFKKYAPLKTLLSFGALLFTMFIFMVVLSHVFFPDLLNNTIEIDFYLYDAFGDVANAEVTFFVLLVGSGLFLCPLSYWLLKEKEV